MIPVALGLETLIEESNSKRKYPDAGRALLRTKVNNQDEAADTALLTHGVTAAEVNSFVLKLVR